METHELEARLRELEGTIAGLRGTVEELQGRVQVTEDVNEIKQLQWTYLNALMATDWDVCASCFAEDALVDVYLHDPVQGRAAIAPLVQRGALPDPLGQRGRRLHPPDHHRRTGTPPRATGFST